jgi:hypothetical protein
MFDRVSADELAGMQVLARRVRSELAAAGLPVPAPGLAPVLAGGAEVMVDDGADQAGGVFVNWAASPRLQACTSRVLRHRQLDDPLLRHSAEVKAAMMQAMAAILTSAGFTVQDADDDYRPYQLRVVDGPAPDVPPIWSPRDDEVAMADQDASDPDQGANRP